jgi:RND family efflux transporter MFP subunit
MRKHTLVDDSLTSAAKYLALALAIATFLAGCSEKSESSGSSALKAVLVATISSTEKAVMIEAVGTVGFRRELSLSFTSPGRITAMNVNEGQHVVRGELLAALDTVNVGGDLSRASAEMTRVQAELQRSEELFKQGWLTKSKLETARSVAASATANLQSARFQLSNSRIIAPQDGLVLQRMAEPSETVQAGKGVVRLGLTESGMVLRAALTDRDVTQLALGAPVSVTISALNGQVQGRLIELAGIADQATGTFECVIALPAHLQLRAGQVGRISLTSSGGGSEIVAPAGSIFGVRAGEGLTYILTTNGQVRLRKVVLGELRRDGIVILSGIVNGERVVVSGREQLRDREQVIASDVSL